MTTDRITVSLDDDTSAALETLTNRTANGQSELVLLDGDVLHCFLELVETELGVLDPEFIDCTDRVSEYHAGEYESRFTNLGELFEWLSVS